MIASLAFIVQSARKAIYRVHVKNMSDTFVLIDNDVWRAW